MTLGFKLDGDSGLLDDSCVCDPPLMGLNQIPSYINNFINEYKNVFNAGDFLHNIYVHNIG